MLLRLRTCALLLAGCALAGCGSSSSSSSHRASNGVASESAAQIAAAAKSASAKAQSVHVSGSTVTRGVPTAVDLRVSEQAGTGTFSEGGLSVQLIGLNGTVYLNGTPGFWQKFAGAAAAQRLAGKWLKAPATNVSFAPIARLANLHDLIGSILGQHGTLAKGAATTIDGQPVVALKDTTQGGTLYVATTGPPYPIELAKTSGSDSGKLTFDEWNAPVKVTAPGNSVDLAQLKGVQ